MKTLQQQVIRAWSNLGPRFLPFSDAASADLPLSRLLRLSLFQVSVGMSLVLLVGTLNRVMIVELGVPASLVAIMIALPVLFAPIRALVGHKSDHHHSAFGWRRVPYMWKGALIQFGGLAIMPFALLVLSGGGEAAQAPAWLGHVGAGLAFLLVGAGLHTTQTVGLALATDLAPEASHPKVVGLMYVMLLVGMMVSALIFGHVLSDFTPARLIQVIQGAAVATLVLNLIALWKQETRRPQRRQRPQPSPPFADAWRSFAADRRTLRRLVAVGLGTMAFSMSDVLLEPYGGEILNMGVGDTTRLTAMLALGGLLGFGLASRVLGGGADPVRMATYGALVGVPAFVAVIASASLALPALFVFGTLLVGFGGGLFSHGTLTATMNLAPKDQAGLALGAWGAVQATAAGLAMALGGVLRDLAASLGSRDLLGASMAAPASAYNVVYGVEIALMLLTVVALLPLLRRSGRPQPA